MRGSAGRLQSQRFEYKYIIDEPVALGVRNFVRSYLTIDEYGARLPNLSYPVHSLYLDSPDLKLYQSTINGDKNRFKLRIRLYENRPDAPVYFEIKRRMNDTIAKERGAVRREAVSILLKGQLPAPEHLATDYPRHLVAVQHFNHHITRLHARPRTHVAYLREAWRSEMDNSVRVTIDRNVRSELNPGLEVNMDMVRPRLVFGHKVVLELKFTARFPDWFGDLVRVFGLTRCCAAKYADGVTRLGPSLVSRAFSLDDYDHVAQRRLQRIDRGPNGWESASAPAAEWKESGSSASHE